MGLLARILIGALAPKVIGGIGNFLNHGDQSGGGPSSGVNQNALNTANQQHDLNLQAARNSAQLSQVDQSNPFLQSRWTGEIGTPGRQQTTKFQPWLSNVLFGGGGPQGGGAR